MYMGPHVRVNIYTYLGASKITSAVNQCKKGFNIAMRVIEARQLLFYTRRDAPRHIGLSISRLQLPFPQGLRIRPFSQTFLPTTRQMSISAQTESQPQRFTLPDGATLVYNVLGEEHLGKGKLPLVMIVGRACLRSDWEPLFPSIYAKRPGESERKVPCVVCLMRRQFWCMIIGMVGGPR